MKKIKIVVNLHSSECWIISSQIKLEATDVVFLKGCKKQIEVEQNAEIKTSLLKLVYINRIEDKLSFLKGPCSQISLFVTHEE